MTRLLSLAALLSIIALIAPGCAREKTASAPALTPGPQYSRPLPPGQSALRLVTDPRRYPDLGRAYRDRDALLLAALEESLRWFAAPSSRQFFPFEGITHDQARESVVAMLELLEHAPGESAFVADVRRLFDVYESVGYNGQGVVLFTGYYAPIFNASRTRTERFTHPLYRRPEDLVTDPVTGEPQGRRTGDGSIVPYYTRREIEASNMFAGRALVWLEDALSAYIIHVNGSAKLRLTDGSVMYIGYAGKTDRPYASLGQAMVEAGLLRRGAVTLSAIRRTFRRHPQRVRDLMLENENYVFFTEYEGGNWPAGSLGVKVTAERSLATDKRIYPRGGVLLVDTEAVTFASGTRAFLRFVLDQDTGGAIQAPGRADIFMGVGPGAEILAGGQCAEGRLYYLFLKPQYVPTGESTAGHN
jgi:membrane-bound lytic murein transglycosylase A